MSDANVTIEAVDRAIDIMDSFCREVHDLRAQVCFDLDSTAAAFERAKWAAEEYEEENECRNHEEVRELAFMRSIRGEELRGEWSGLCFDVVDLAADAKHQMAEYIRKLNKIAIKNERMRFGSMNSAPEYHVVIVDSKKFPQTAEHIRVAQKMGLPEFLTLERSGAAARREASLKHVRAISVYDRDEWPMAVFKEGGYGAHVFYVEPSDNRGAGASVGRQMKDFPEGTRVRIRVI